MVSGLSLIIAMWVLGHHIVQAVKWYKAVDKKHGKTRTKGR